MKRPSATANYKLPTNNLLKIGQAAKILGISIDTLRRWERKGKIHSVKTPGGTRFYSLAELERINPKVSQPKTIFDLSTQPQSPSTEELLKRIELEGTGSELEGGKLIHPEGGQLGEEPENLLPIKRYHKLSKVVSSRFLITLALALMLIPSLITLSLLASYRFFPQNTQDLLSNKIASGLISPFDWIALQTLSKLSPEFVKSNNLAYPELPTTNSQLRTLNSELPTNNSDVLAVTTSPSYLEVNTDTQINGSLFVRDSINNTTIEATESANAFTITSGSTSLKALGSSSINQDLLTSSSPSFASINLTNSSNQLNFKTATSSGTLTWSPASVHTLILPDVTDTIAVLSASQRLTNKSILSSTIDSTPIGQTTADKGSFTTLKASSDTTLSGALTVSGATTLSSTLSVSSTTTLSSSLTVSGATQFDGTVKLKDGTAASPALTFTNDTNTGLYRLGADNIGLITAGTATSGITIDANGNLGVGTITPSYKLDVAGTTHATGAVTFDSTLGVTGATTLSSTLAVTGAATFSSDLTVDTNTFYVNSTTNRVGIGTTSPVFPLQVWGDNTNSASFLNGNVGIGTTAPSAQLTVASNAVIGSNQAQSSATLEIVGSGNTVVARNSSSTNYASYNIYNDQNSSSRSLQLAYSGSAYGSSLLTGGTTGESAAITTTGAYPLSLGVNNTAKLTIDSTGNIGIGTTSPTTAFYVNGKTTVTNHILAANSSVDIGSSAIRFSTGYFNTIDALNVAGTITGGSTTSNSWTINSDNATNDNEDMSLAFFRGTASPNAVLGWNSSMTSPSQYFTLNSGLQMTGTISNSVGINLGSFNYDLTTPSGENLSIFPGGTAYNGNLGIGTTTPYSKVQIKGSGTSTGITLQTTGSTGGWGLSVLDNGNVGIGTTGPVARFQINESASNPFVVTSGGNVGIGFTSPAYNLHVVGTSNITGNATFGSQILLANGSASSPSYSFTNLTNAGLWTNGNGLLLTTGGTNTSGITVSGAGNVGIGLTYPSFKLDVTDTSSASVLRTANINLAAGYTGSSTNVALRATNSVTDGTATGPNGGGQIALYGFSSISSAGDALGIYTEGRNTGSGNAVGLSTAGVAAGGSPAKVFGLIAAAQNAVNQSISGFFTRGNSAYPTLTSGNYGIFVQGGDSSDILLALQSKGSQSANYFEINSTTTGTGGDILTVNSSGNIGIGNASPKSLLYVSGNAMIGYSSGGPGANMTNSLAIAGNLGVGTSSPSQLFQVNTSTSNPFVVTSGGNVGIGFTTPTSLLQVQGTGAPGAWKTNANSLPAARYRQASVVANGYIYVIGGYSTGNASTVFYAKVNADGSTGTWGTTTSLPISLSQMPAVTANGYIYVLGGDTSGGGTATDAVYYAKVNADGTLGSWNTTTSMPQAKRTHTGLVANGYIYAIAGAFANGVYYAKINSDGTIGSWSTASTLPQNVSAHTSVVVNGYVYVIGGNSLSTVYYAQINSNGSLGSWNTAVNSLPANRGQASSGTANGYIYVLGGNDGAGNNYASTVYYTKVNSDGSVGSWSTTTMGGMQEHSSVVVNGYLYEIGGNNGSIQTSVYYSPLQRVSIQGDLDLLGLTAGGGPLGDLSGDNSLGSTGGSIYAGNIFAGGGLEVSGNANFWQGAGFNGPVNIGIGTTSASSPLFTVSTSLTSATTPYFTVTQRGNVGIGTSGPSSTLQIGSGQIFVPNGSASAPSYSFTNSTSTGLYSPSTNALALVTNGASTPALTITAAGNVGIGITAPSGVFQVGSSATTPVLFASSLTGNVGVGTANPSTALYVAQSVPTDLAGVYADNTSATGYYSIFRALEQGDVNKSGSFTYVNSSYPTNNLNFASSLQIGSGTSATGGIVMKTNAAAPIIFGVNGSTEAMRIDSTGNIGIGFSTPGALVDIKGTSPYVFLDRLSGTNSPQISLRLSNAEKAVLGIAGSTNALINNSVSGDLAFRANNQKILFSTDNGTTANVVINGGNVGIGNSVPMAALNIKSASGVVPMLIQPGSGAGANLINFNDSTTTQRGYMWLSNTVTNALALTGYQGIQLYGGTANSNIGTLAINIDTNGNVGVGTTSPSQLFQINYSSANPFVVTSGGNVGIGFTSPAAKLHVVDPSFPSVPAGASIAVFGSTDGTTNGVSIRAKGTVTGQVADFGEYFPFVGERSDYENGDVVSFTSQKETVSKPSASYDSQMVGVITTASSFAGGADDQTEYDEFGRPTNRVDVALLGRVPVKVSTENGPIEVGDYLTSSSIPGIAMKATHPGQVVGKVLEEFKCPERPTGVEGPSSTNAQSDTSCQGKVMVFVNVSFADPQNVLSSLALDNQGNIIMPKLKTGYLEIDPSIALNNSQLSNANSQLITQSVGLGSDATSSAILTIDPSSSTSSSASSTSYDVSSKLSDLESRIKSLESKVGNATSSATPTSTDSANLASSSANISASASALPADSTQSAQSNPSTSAQDLASLNLTPPETLLTASTSAIVKDLTVEEDATISGMLKSYDATVQNSFKALGKSIFADTTIAGSFSVNGTLSIDNGSEINVIGVTSADGSVKGGILYLQKSASAQGLDILNGKVTIDKNGLLTAQTISASQYRAVAGKAVGSGKILSGTRSIEIQSSVIETTSRILVTPSVETNIPLSVTNKRAGQSFTVSIPTTASADIPFDWFVVNEASP